MGWPVVVGLCVAQHEAGDPIGMFGGQQLRDSAAVVMADNVRPLDPERVEEPDDHGSLGAQ